MDEKGLLETFIAKSPLLGFLVLSMLGGIVAHIRVYEKSGIELTAAQHFWGIVRKIVSAILVSLLVYGSWVGLGWPIAFGFVAAGVASVFSGEALDFMWDKLKGVINARVPVPPTKKD